MIFIYSKKAAGKAESFDAFIKKANIKKPEARKTTLGALPAIEKTVSELKGDHGIIVMSKDVLSATPFGMFRKAKGRTFLSSLMQKVHCPLMLMAGTFPYEKACVPGVDHKNVQYTMETALEIHASLHNELTALLVNPSKYISSDEDLNEFQAMKKTINDVSSMYKISVNKKILDGNLVKSITASLPDFNLLIAGTEGWKHQHWFPSFLSPDIVWNIVHKSSISTLLLPEVEELL